MTDNLTLALRRRAAAIAAHAAAERRARRAEARLSIVEQTLVDVWRWTNDSHPHLQLLTPILMRADAEYAVLKALEELEDANGIADV